MNRLGSLVLLLVLTPAFVGCSDVRTLSGSADGDGKEAREDPGASERVDPAVDRYLDGVLPKGPGITVAAARGGALKHCAGRGLADRAAEAPATCDTVYDVMSMTKQFTAAAVLKLEMAGELRVTDRIDRYLGPVPDDKRDITLHQLLTHTAGLPEGLGDDYEPVSRAEMLTGAMKARLRSAPGKEFHYSNVGYSLLAAIVEKVSGQSYERFLAERLFRPAGMTGTGYVLPAWDRAQVAVEYDRHGRAQGRPMDHPWAPDGPFWNLRGNGGMLSTARDMFRWHRALTGDTVLSSTAKRKLFSPQVRVPELDGSYGYGWVVVDTDDGRVAWHDGGNDWSLGTVAEYRRQRIMVFWVSNHAYQKGKWNLEDGQLELSHGVAERVRRPV
ncbi:serine hydrolase domain-containing protein [Streptomyces sp. Je 1-369]|uniref:serine hydrolase domain-containing protein n=1 Tax=Streptomyces sp. Je 1-369 TaxID=2966192 RepID=UPI002286C0BA|nr:serine hydrolase domain-containing protein [Streptomyces sp. Je 1-369]WAL93904.1 beta-lactamase family protein [Streptomyces sp. Je 1-369]